MLAHVINGKKEATEQSTDNKTGEHAMTRKEPHTPARDN